MTAERQRWLNLTIGLGRRVMSDFGWVIAAANAGRPVKSDRTSQTFTSQSPALRALAGLEPSYYRLLCKTNDRKQES